MAARRGRTRIVSCMQAPCQPRGIQRANARYALWLGLANFRYAARAAGAAHAVGWRDGRRAAPTRGSPVSEQPAAVFRKGSRSAPDGYFRWEAAGLAWLADAPGGAGGGQGARRRRAAPRPREAVLRQPRPGDGRGVRRGAGADPRCRRPGLREPAGGLGRRRVPRAGDPAAAARAAPERVLGRVLRRAAAAAHAVDRGRQRLSTTGPTSRRVRADRATAPRRGVRRRLGAGAPPRRPVVGQHRVDAGRGQCSSTRRRTAATARPTWRCWRCSAARTGTSSSVATSGSTGSTRSGRERVALHQLHPLLVHAVLFGADYPRRALELARRYR